MNIAILGYGGQGASALDYYQAQGGHIITVCDQNEQLHLPEGITGQLGPDYLKDLNIFDLIVRSPSIHPRVIVTANQDDESILDKVTTNTNIFMEVCPTRNIIGVTGTKGKGTTSTLIARMLEAAGFRTHLGGNIGTPPLEMLRDDIKSDDWVVLELANFQLIDLKQSPHIAVCVMVEPEHQDWHGDVQEYIQSKQQLFRWQTPDDITVFYPENELTKEVVSVSKAQKIPYFAEPGALIKNNKVVIDQTEICDIGDIKLLGRHNWQNVCAATTAVWQIIQNTEAISQAIRETSSLPFRLEFTRELNGVKYYNDSFGTTPATAIVAIEAFTEPKIIILGGSDKGADFSELAQTVKNNNVKAAITIGAMGPIIAEALRSVGFDQIIEGDDSMVKIVGQAHKVSEPGDVVLLSTACASFDMFENYKDRGEQFNQAVQLLA